MSVKHLFGLAAAFALAGFAPAADDHPLVALAKKDLKNPDKPFVTWVSVTAKAGKEKELEQAFLECQKDVRKEKGNLAYDILRGPDRKYYFHEKWTGADGLADHLAADHTKKLLDKFKDLLDGDPAVHCCSAVEEECRSQHVTGDQAAKEATGSRSGSVLAPARSPTC